eukprot:GHVS01039103.1.p1 GENE.GHVS01039103.1~~GHVS01039103.1.p1  ORF type:complete len:359 (+),score=71.84 GHVS01039103.1:173-1249(+)
MKSFAFVVVALCCSGFSFLAPNVEALPAIPLCREPLRLQCLPTAVAAPAAPTTTSPVAPCVCVGTLERRRDERCPDNSKPQNPSPSFASSSMRCVVEVTDETLGVCNHGMVKDVRNNKCMASRTMEAMCHCPAGFVIQGQHCVKEVGSPTVARRRLFKGKRSLGETPSSSSGRRQGDGDGVRLVGNGLSGKAIVRDLECRCPDAMITAAQFRRRTADSSVDEVEEEADKIVRPGHGGCVLVEYHDLLNKCTDDKGKVTVDSDGNPTKTNDCTNKVVVLADKYCKQDEQEEAGEKWVQKCAGPGVGGGRGFGFLANDKHCWCEKKHEQAVNWTCVRGGTPNIERDSNGVVTRATCELTT